MSKVPMTSLGAAALREELDKLKSIERPAVIEAIAEARAHGDLRENAEYAAAKESQAFIEGRIREIEGKLSNAQIVNVSEFSQLDKIVFGATVSLINLDTDDETTYQIVGEDEADLKVGKISVASPLARALIGKEVGDVVEVTTPSGEVEYEIHTIEYK